MKIIGKYVHCFPVPVDIFFITTLIDHYVGYSFQFVTLNKFLPYKCMLKTADHYVWCFCYKIRKIHGELYNFSHKIYTKIVCLSLSQIKYNNHVFGQISSD